MRVPRTFVFVDLSGFTRYAEEKGDLAAGDVLSAFRAVAREVASDRGVRIAKWLGDGCMVVAMDHNDAVVFSLELQRRATAACALVSLLAMPFYSRATTTSAPQSIWPRAYVMQRVAMKSYSPQNRPLTFQAGSLRSHIRS
jgi:hypothetical protein